MCRDLVPVRVEARDVGLGDAAVGAAPATATTPQPARTPAPRSARRVAAASGSRPAPAATAAGWRAHAPRDVGARLEHRDDGVGRAASRPAAGTGRCRRPRRAGPGGTPEPFSSACAAPGGHHAGQVPARERQRAVVGAGGEHERVGGPLGRRPVCARAGVHAPDAHAAVRPPQDRPRPAVMSSPRWYWPPRRALPSSSVTRARRAAPPRGRREPGRPAADHGHGTRPHAAAHLVAVGLASDQAGAHAWASPVDGDQAVEAHADAAEQPARAPVAAGACARTRTPVGQQRGGDRLARGRAAPARRRSVNVTRPPRRSGRGERLRVERRRRRR